MQQQKKQKHKKISNVEKNFIYQCEICYQDYDTKQHIPMIVCSNHHALCSKCVNSNLFKKEYNAHKNPTGRYMCSKCSQIVQKQFIRQHKILMQVCQYIKTIKHRDQQLKKQFYNYVGSMGMNLVAMRSDYDTLQRNNLILSKQNELLIEENSKLRENFEKIQKLKGSLEELERVHKKVQQMNDNFQMQKATLESLKDQVKRKNDQIKNKNNQVLASTQSFLQLQGQLNRIRQQIKIGNRKSKQILQQNQGSINLRQYLEQQINNLKNQKKKLIQDNQNRKSQMNQNLKIIQNCWQKIIKGQTLKSTIETENNQKNKQQKPYILQNNSNFQIKSKIEQKPQNIEIKNHSLVKSQCEPQLKIKYEQKSKKIIEYENIIKFDFRQKSIKQFVIDDNIVSLSNPKLYNYVNISLDEGFDFEKDYSYTIKIRKLQSQQMMIGLMSSDCKNKKNIYNRKGFFAIDGFGQYWSQGGSVETKFSFKEGDQVKVSLIIQSRKLCWSKNGNKVYEIKELPADWLTKTLYPVVLMIQSDDSVEFLEVK